MNLSETFLLKTYDLNIQQQQDLNDPQDRFPGTLRRHICFSLEQHQLMRQCQLRSNSSEKVICLKDHKGIVNIVCV